LQSSIDELRLSQDSLRELSEETGGFAFVNRNNVDEAFDRIVSENSSYYVLGYYAPNDRRDGRFRKIEVRVTRPGITVRARAGTSRRAAAGSDHEASNDPLETALKAAVESPLPTSGIPMRLFAAPYKGTAPNAAVAIAVELNIKREVHREERHLQQRGEYRDVCGRRRWQEARERKASVESHADAETVRTRA
jgi:hypothetical protein